MPGRQSSIAVRIVLVALHVLAPVLIWFTIKWLFSPLAGAIGPTLAMVCWGWLLGAVLIAPAALLFSGSDSSSGASDDSDDGGTGPQPPQSPSGAPKGGIPLPDADQTRDRVRDHDRLRSRGRPPRRPAREPRRAPVSTLADS